MMGGQTKAIQALLLSTTILAGCGGGGSGDGDTSTDGSTQYDELWEFYELMQENALDFDYTDGVWDMDQGDGRFYGIAYYARVGYEQDVEAYRVIADEARDHNITLLEEAISSFAYYVEHLEEVMMATLGLIEYSAITGDGSFIPQVDAIIDQANDLLALYGDYLDPGDVESWALELYGPTAITGGMVNMNIQYAMLLDTDRRQDRIDRAIEIVSTIDTVAFDGQRYLFAPGVDRMYLYPNSMMILVLTRMHEMTGDDAYLARAESVFDAIQVLSYTDRPGYYSPYSAEIMGATTQDYSTFSVHNYLMLGLMQLYTATDQQAYLDEAVELMLFVRDYLYNPDDRLVTHHWMDGAIAQPDHFEYFCSGCNLQFLYVMWWLRNRVL